MSAIMEACILQRGADHGHWSMGDILTPMSAKARDVVQRGIANWHCCFSVDTELEGGQVNG